MRLIDWIAPAMFGLIAVDPALAEGPAIGVPAAAIPGPTKVNVVVGANAATLGAAANATAAANNLADAANSLAGASGAVADAGNALADSMKKLAKALPNDGQIDGLLDIGNDTVGVLQSFNDLLTKASDGNWAGKFDRFNSSLEVLADGVSALSDPSRIGRVAAVAGFAGTLASELAASASSSLWLGAEAIREAITHEKRDALDTLAIETILGSGGTYGRLQARARSLTHLVDDAVGLLRSTLALEEVRKKEPGLAGMRPLGERESKDAREAIEQRRRESRLLEMQAQALVLSDPMKANECLVRKGTIDREIAEAEEGLSRMEAVLSALDQMAPNENSPREMAKRICTNLGQDAPGLQGSVFGDLYIHLGDMQSLRLKVLAAERGFVRETAKRRSREMRKESGRGRKSLEQEREVRRNENRELKYRDDLLLTKVRSWADKEAERLWKGALRELSRTYGMTESDQMQRVSQCIADVAMKQGYAASPFQAEECEVEVNVAFGTGDFQKRRGQLYASQGDFKTRMRGFVDEQVALLEELSPQFEVDQAYLLSWMEKFGRVAADQAVAETQLRDVAKVEREFTELCGKLDVPGWKYVPKGPLH